MVKWRHRVGADRLEVLLSETLRLALVNKQVTSQQCRHVTVDTTVQKKAVISDRAEDWPSQIGPSNGSK